jgi:hypothetical protein
MPPILTISRSKPEPSVPKIKGPILLMSDFSTKIAEAYTSRPIPLKCDHWSLKEVDMEEHFHFFGMIKNNRYVVVNPDIYLNAFLAAAEVLERNGYTVDRMDPGRVNIVYTNTTNTLAVSSGFAVHCDNDGYQNKKINSGVGEILSFLINQIENLNINFLKF